MNDKSDAGRDIAIVGMAGIFPGARDVREYWWNNVNAIDGIGPIPAERWPGASFDSLAPTHIAHIRCRRGGFIPSDITIDARAAGVMPKLVREGDAEQFVMLEVVRCALEDAGIAGDDAIRRRTNVIVGRGGYMSRALSETFLRFDTVSRVVPFLRLQFPRLDDDQFAQLEAKLFATLSPLDTDALVTGIPNLVASRVANRLDLGGPAYVVDAACASSLLALEHAVRDLREHECDLAVAGGIHLCQYPPFWWYFSQLQAVSLSETIRPFDRRADGLLLGEGAGALVLKRRDDAWRNGDRVYAVVKGVGSSSDGRDAAILAPSVRGQTEALLRAYRDAALSPDGVGYLEAHGTGTAVGDAAEIATIRAVFGTARHATRAMGSVKSMIGHAMPAAGMASLIRVALALSNRIFPPTLHCEQPREDLADLPFFVCTRTQPWLHAPEQGPRRAAVNSFGFGGINAHAVLEEATPPGGGRPAWAQRQRRCQAMARSSEVFMLSAPTREALREAATVLAAFLRRDRSAARARDVAYSLSVAVDARHSWRLALVCESAEQLARLLQDGVAMLENPAPAGADGPIWVTPNAASSGRRIAVLLHGGMDRSLAAGDATAACRDLCLHVPALQDVLDALGSKSGPTSYFQELVMALLDVMAVPATSVVAADLASAEAAGNLIIEVGASRVHTRAQVGDDHDADAITQVNRMVAALFTAGMNLDVRALFESRDCRLLDFARPQPPRPQPPERLRFSLAWPSFPALRGPSGQAPGAHPAASGGGLPATSRAPFVGRVLASDPGRSVVFERELSIEEDLFLADHTFVNASACKPVEQCLPVLPLSMMMEIMAEAASLLAPGRKVVGLRDVRATRLVSLEGVRSRVLRVEAVVSEEGRSSRRAVVVQLCTAGEVHASGVVELADGYTSAPWNPRFSLSNPRPWPIRAAQLYAERHMFHGPRFHAVSSLDLEGDDGLTAGLRAMPRQGLFASCPDPALHLDPCALDAVGQLLGSWTMNRDCCVLPVSVDEVEIHGPPPPPGTTLPARLRIGTFDPTAARVVAEAEIGDGAGGTWIRIKGWTDAMVAVPRRMYDVVRFPTRYCLSEFPALPGLPAGCVCAVVSEENVSFGKLGSTAQMYLDDAELKVLDGLTGLRRSHFLLGRIAAKDAVRRYLAGDSGGEMLHPAAIRIGNDPSGRPHLQAVSGVARLPQLSIAHAERVAVALAGTQSVGIDLEPQARERDLACTDFATPREVAIIDGARAQRPNEAWGARLWCAKEAAAKALGIGLSELLGELEVASLEDQARFRIRHASLGRELDVATAQNDSLVLAYCAAES